MNLKGGIRAALLVCLFLLTAGTATFAEPAKKPASPDLMKEANAAGPQKFVPATKEEAAAAIDYSKKAAKDVAEKLQVKFDTLETRHFLIFTNWDPREHFFLKDNVELAYTCVSRQFQIPVEDNVFVGKLPVYMFAKREEFENFSKDFDKFDSSKLAGYYTGNSKGFGHMAMWKPDVKAALGDVHLAERIWAYVLVHEFTHAFVARYRTNGFVPRWLNEGVAEVVAYHQFPRPETYAAARKVSSSGFQKIFEDRGIANFTAGDYPIAQTTVETMIAGGPKIFLKYFNDIKDGVDPDEALMRGYKVDRKGLEEAWKKYIADAKDISIDQYLGRGNFRRN